MVERGMVVVALILGAVVFDSSAAGADPVSLRFRPEIGVRQTVRITTHMASTPKNSDKDGATERHWVLTLELEPTDIAADGSVTIRARILRIQHKLSALHGTQEVCVIDVDSADESWRHDDSPRQTMQDLCTCLAATGEHFTAVVSARGRIIQVNDEAFCAAVARKRIQYEDEMIRRKTIRIMEGEYKDESERRRRRHLEADVTRAIKRENARYGSAAQREQDHRNEASECHLYSTGQLRLLLNDVLVPFPEEPMAKEGSWTAPFLMVADGPIQLTGRYTLASDENGTRTIEIEARRSPDDQSINEPNIPDEHRTRLEGVSRATLKIDATTGVLLSKEVSADLTGQTPILMPEGPSPAKMQRFKVVEVSLIDARATTIVETQR